MTISKMYGTAVGIIMMIRIVGCLLAGCFCLAAAELLPNGAFEGKTVPDRWSPKNSRGAQAEFSLKSEKGRRFLHVVNRSPQEPHVWAALYQTIRLEPGRRYGLTGESRGSGAPLMWILGKSWGLRIMLPGAAAWRTFSTEFTAPAGNSGQYNPDGSIDLHLVTDNLTPGLDLANLSLQPLPVAEHSFEDRRAELSELKKEIAEFDAACRRQYAGRELPAAFALPLAALADGLRWHENHLQTADDAAEARAFWTACADYAFPTVREMLDTLRGKLEAGRPLPESWRMVSATDPVILKEGVPHARQRSDSGREELRPAFWGGYGHFVDCLREDMPLLGQLGANIIQIEIGPSKFFPREGTEREFEPDFTAYRREIAPMLELARINNLKVCLLISPHYSPDWLLKKYPQMRNDRGGFLKYDVNSARGRELVSAYIDALCRALRDDPNREVLHSLCLSNEPIYTNFVPENPDAVARFGNWMTERYGSVDAFNREAQRGYGSWNEMLPERYRDPAVRYDFLRCGRAAFAEWHAFMAEQLRRELPGIPLHAKLLMPTTDTPALLVDPEEFASFSDYNGNDNVCYMDSLFYRMDWLPTVAGNVLQYSMKPAPVVNSENHIIPDGELRPVSNDHVYTANFQQYATGAGALITWTWASYSWSDDGRKFKDLQHCIRMRPGNVAANTLALLDAQRLAPELCRLTAAEADAAILYSSTSVLQNGGVAAEARRRLFAELASTGFKIRFLSEKQLARGEFGGVKLLFCAGSEYLPRDAAGGIARFARQGGRIFADRASLRKNEFGNPLKRDFPLTELTDAPGQLKAALPPLPVSLAGAVDGIFYRAVPEGDGNWLINLVNYTHRPVPLSLRGDGVFENLLTGAPFSPPELDPLPPLKPQLIRFSPR